MDKLINLLAIFSKYYPDLKNVNVEITKYNNLYIARCLVDKVGDYINVKKGRILNWFSSEDTLAESWNILQSKISIGSGELLGEGFLGSKQNEFNFLPEADTDFIFSIYAEQFGFLGVALILILLGIFIFSGLSGFRQKNILADDYSAYYLGIYFLLVITFSFLINIFMVSGLIPVVGLPLPFFTKGGSSLLCFSIMLGFIFSAKTYLKT